MATATIDKAVLAGAAEYKVADIGLAEPGLADDAGAVGNDQG